MSGHFSRRATRAPAMSAACGGEVAMMMPRGSLAATASALRVAARAQKYSKPTGARIRRISRAGDAVKKSAALERHFERRVDAVHGTGDRQGVVFAAVRRFADAIGDEVNVETHSREFAREKAESLGAHERTRREVIRHDEQGGALVHAAFRRRIARIT